MPEWFHRLCRMIHRRPKRPVYCEDGRLSFRHVHRYDAWAKEDWDYFLQFDQEPIGARWISTLVNVSCSVSNALSLIHMQIDDDSLIDRTLDYGIRCGQWILDHPQYPPEHPCYGGELAPSSICQIKIDLLHARWLRSEEISPSEYRDLSHQMLEAAMECRAVEAAEMNKEKPRPPGEDSCSLAAVAARLALIAQDRELIDRTNAATFITEDLHNYFDYLEKIETDDGRYLLKTIHEGLVDHCDLLRDVASRDRPIEDTEFRRRFDAYFDRFRAPIVMPNSDRYLLGGGIGCGNSIELAMIRDLYFISQDGKIDKGRVLDALGF